MSLDLDWLPTPTTPLLEAALLYASHHWPVFPVHSSKGGVCSCGGQPNCKPGKHPIAALVPHGLKDATSNEDTLRRWWHLWPNANLGLPQGNLLALDIDGPLGERSLEALAQENWGLPQTLAQKTHRGRHLFFTPPKDRAFQNRTHALPGVDVRTLGGYVLVSPSIHPTGQVYEWICSSAAARLPDWLARAITSQERERPGQEERVHSEDALPPSSRVDRARKYLEAIEGAREGQGGSKVTYRAACAMVLGFDLSPPMARQLLQEVYNPKCLGPWSEADLWRLVTRVHERERGPRGYLLGEASAQNLAQRETHVASTTQGESMPTHEKKTALTLPPKDELLTEAPLCSLGYDLAKLERDRTRVLASVDLAPLDPTRGYGWGPRLNTFFGGGLAPGALVGIGANAAGSGKTAFTMQLADGFALRSAHLVQTDQPGPLTPVFILSEMSLDDLSRRSLGRMLGEPAYYFRAGESAARSFAALRPQVDRAYEAAKRVMSPTGDFTRMRHFQRQVTNTFVSGVHAIEKVRSLVSQWREHLATAHPGRDIWPIVVIDPIQRWQDRSKPEVEALNELCELLDMTADTEGWIVLATSDSTKTSATAPREETSGAAMFRGSYKLQHATDHAVGLDRPEELSGERCRYLALLLIKNRWGPGYGRLLYRWEGATGRFDPLTEEEQADIERRLREEQAERRTKAKTAEKKEPNGTPGEKYF